MTGMVLLQATLCYVLQGEVDVSIYWGGFGLLSSAFDSNFLIGLD